MYGGKCSTSPLSERATHSSHGLPSGVSTDCTAICLPQGLVTILSAHRGVDGGMGTDSTIPKAPSSSAIDKNVLVSDRLTLVVRIKWAPSNKNLNKQEQRYLSTRLIRRANLDPNNNRVLRSIPLCNCRISRVDIEVSSAMTEAFMEHTATTCSPFSGQAQRGRPLVHRLASNGIVVGLYSLGFTFEHPQEQLNKAYRGISTCTIKSRSVMKQCIVVWLEGIAHSTFHHVLGDAYGLNKSSTLHSRFFDWSFRQRSA